MSLNRLFKVTFFFFFSVTAETRRQRISVFDLSWEQVCWPTQIFATLHIYVIVYKIVLGVINKIFGSRQIHKYGIHK